MPKVPYPYEVNGKLVTGNGSLIQALLLSRGFFGTQKNRVKGKQRYRRTILVLKWENGTFEFPKSTFWAKVHYICIKSDDNQIKKKSFCCLIFQSYLHCLLIQLIQLRHVSRPWQVELEFAYEVAIGFAGQTVCTKTIWCVLFIYYVHINCQNMSSQSKNIQK